MKMKFYTMCGDLIELDVTKTTKIIKGFGPEETMIINPFEFIVVPGNFLKYRESINEVLNKESKSTSDTNDTGSKGADRLKETYHDLVSKVLFAPDEKDREEAVNKLVKSIHTKESVHIRFPEPMDIWNRGADRLLVTSINKQGPCMRWVISYIICGSQKPVQEMYVENFTTLCTYEKSINPEDFKVGSYVIDFDEELALIINMDEDFTMLFEDGTTGIFNCYEFYSRFTPAGYSSNKFMKVLKSFNHVRELLINENAPAKTEEDMCKEAWKNLTDINIPDESSKIGLRMIDGSYKVFAWRGLKLVGTEVMGEVVDYDKDVPEVRGYSIKYLTEPGILIFLN